MDQSLLQQLVEKVEAMSEKLDRLTPEYEGVIDNEEFVKLMGISTRTAHVWRSEGKIGYVQINKKIYYRRRDIETFLDSRYQAPFAKNRVRRAFEDLKY